MELSESLEDYLEAILILSKEKKVVRVKDLMKYLGYKVSSINTAINNLSAKGLVEHEKYGYIELTAEGTVLAEKVYDRHKNITRFFQEVLGVPKETACQDACRIEHILNEETYNKFLNFLNYILDSQALKDYSEQNHG